MLESALYNRQVENISTTNPPTYMGFVLLAVYKEVRSATLYQSSVSIRVKKIPTCKSSRTRISRGPKNYEYDMAAPNYDTTRLLTRQVWSFSVNRYVLNN